MKILAFGASSSHNSINRTLAAYAASLIEDAEVEILDLNDFDLPLFSEDKEKELGQPKEAKIFLQRIKAADAIIVSFAEHNASYTAAYKNIFDWTSRITQEVFCHKKTVYLSTSPGPGGAQNVLNAARDSAPFFGSNLKASLSIPSFYDNFDFEKGEVTNEALRINLIETVKKLI